MKAVLVAVIGLALLVGVALMLNPPGGGGSRGPASPIEGLPLASFDPALVTSVSVTHPAQREQRAERRADGRWVLTTSPLEWPVALPAQAPGALAALAGLVRDPQPAPAPPESDTVTLSLGLADRSTVALRVAREQLGGRVRVWAAGASASAEVAPLQPLLNPGPASWRMKQALPGARDASRLTVTKSTGETIALARIDNRWTLRRPVAARAEPAAVESLLGALASLPVLRFDDAPATPLADMGLARPALVIEAETDLRDAGRDASVRTLSRRLLVGGPANAAGDELFAAPEESPSFVMTIPASAVASVSTVARNYLSPIVSAANPADVYIVTVRSLLTDDPTGERSFRRELDAWVRLMPDGSRIPADAAPVAEVLAFLTETPGEPDAAGSAEDLRPVARLSLFDNEGDPLDLITVGFTADGDAAFRSGLVLTMFSAARVPALIALPDFASLPAPAPGAAPPKPVLPQGAPTGK